ncbi:MAG: sigma 54-interacting transcriptional regulator [Candidatus Sumerlaeota bacterium]|nr:sigma 54-interacting transcriptional regulator [Candidatus Sumerlaeota bacterium]
MPGFIVKYGSDPGKMIPMNSQRLLFGRADDCDVVVDDPNVSRHHASALLLNGLVMLVDLDSSNGTLVNELPISRIFLSDGDEIRLGETVLVYGGGEDETARYSGAAPAAAARWQTGRGQASASAETTAEDDLGRTQIFAPLSDDIQSDALKDIHLKLKALYSVFHEVVQAPSLKEVFEKAGRAIVAGAGTERVIFFLSAEKTGEGWYKHHVQMAANVEKENAEKTAHEGLLRRASDDRQLTLARIESDGRINYAGAGANALAAPLLRAGRVAAMIYADNPETGAAISKNDADFITTLALQIGVRLNQFEQVQQLKEENLQLRSQIEPAFTIIAQSEPMKQIMAISQRVAESDSAVLITGESGTGKELVARAIHNLSHRAARPLVAVNCAALPDTLLESELFGHEKGAFTGAHERRMGKFEQAEGGTLFLDEIGDISAAAQAKLLRALQEREIQRVGGSKIIKVDVRLIAATNKDLTEAVCNGAFRQDLYFRVRVIEMPIPPLRDRPEDIQVLSEYFLKQLRRQFPTPVRRIAPETIQVLQRYSFPGNVRELRNIIERGLVFANGEKLLPEHLPREVLQQDGGAPPFARKRPEQEPEPKAPAGLYSALDSEGRPLTLAEMEARHIQFVLERVKGSKVQAASLLGISRTTLYDKLKVAGTNE